MIAPALALAACAPDRGPAAPVASEPTPVDHGSLAAIAPRSTRVMAAASPDSSLVTTMLAKMPGRDCGDLAPKITGAEMFAGDGWGPIIEIYGSITVADVACGLARELAPDGSLELPNATVIATAHGVRAVAGALPPPPHVAPPAIAERFHQVRDRAPLVLVADLGAREAPVLVEMTQSDTMAGFVFELPDEASAQAVGDELTAFAAALTALEPSAAMQPPTRRGQTLTWINGVAPHEAINQGPVREHLLEAFTIPSSSMAPGLEIGDHVLVAKGTLAPPLARGQVVVVHVNGKDFVKRVIGLPGDVVAADARGLVINGQPLVAADPIAGHVMELDENDGSWTRLDVTFATETHGGRSYSIVVDEEPERWTQTVTVPAGHVFVVGDFRGNSVDSRMFGAVPNGDVVGVPRAIWYASGHDGLAWDRMFTPVR